MAKSQFCQLLMQRKFHDIQSNIVINGFCHEWQGRLSPLGYAKVSFMGKDWLVHRLVCMVKEKGLSRGPVVRHTCDNRKCINPDHLLSGTQAENIQDAIDRKRFKWCKSDGH